MRIVKWNAPNPNDVLTTPPTVEDMKQIRERYLERRLALIADENFELEMRRDFAERRAKKIAGGQ
jgi:hypothetical protein